MKVIYSWLALRIIQHLGLSLKDSRDTQRIQTQMHRVPKGVLIEVNVWSVLNGCSVEIDRTNEDKDDGSRYLIYDVINENKCSIGIFFSEYY